MTSFLPVSVQGITFQNINRRAQPRRTEDRELQHMRSLLACLEHIGDGMILLDPHLRVDYMTGSASGLLKTCKDQISVQNGQLILSDPGKARHLREFAKKAFSSDVGCGGGDFLYRPPARRTSDCLVICLVAHTGSIHGATVAAHPARPWSPL